MLDGGLKSSLVRDVACGWPMSEFAQGDAFATLAKVASSCLNCTEEFRHQGRMSTFEMTISGRDPRTWGLGRLANQPKRGALSIICKTRHASE